jgi:hypothetical protein
VQIILVIACWAISLRMFQQNPGLEPIVNTIAALGTLFPHPFWLFCVSLFSGVWLFVQADSPSAFAFASALAAFFGDPSIGARFDLIIQSIGNFLLPNSVSTAWQNWVRILKPVLFMAMLGSVAVIYYGIRPCGWLDVYLNRSGCVRAFSIHPHVPFREVDAPFTDVSLSLDGSLIVGATEKENRVDLWTVEEGTHLLTLNTPEPQYVHVSSESNTITALTNTGSIIIWDITSRQVISQSQISYGLGVSILFSPQGDLIVIADENKLFAYESSTGKLAAQFDFEYIITAFAISNDSSALLVGLGYDARLIDFERRNVLWAISLDHSNNGVIEFVTFSRDSSLVGIYTSAPNSGTDVFSSQDGTLLRETYCSAGSWMKPAGAISSDGSVVAFRGYGFLAVCKDEHSSYTPIFSSTYERDQKSLFVAFSPDEKYVLSDYFGEAIHIYKISETQIP